VVVVPDVGQRGDQHRPHPAGRPRPAGAVGGDREGVTGDLREAIGAAEHRALIKPKPLQRAVQGGFSVDDFSVHEQAGTVTRPNQVTRPISPGRVATFGPPAAPAPWPSDAPPPRPAGRSSCTNTTTSCAPPAAPGPPTPTCAPSTPSRPTVERTVAQVATRGGRRLKLRYRGTTKNAWLKRRTAALNLRNLIGRGLDHLHSTWALNTA
jgi:hypothetical protein